MKLLEILQDQRDQYNQFVAVNTSGSFLQSWEWGSWQASLGRDICRYWILDDIGSKIASAQFIKMPLFGQKYYLYAPYGPVISEKLPSFAEASAGKQVTSDRFLNQIKEKFPEAIFIRIEPKDGSLVTRYPSPVTKSPNIQPGKTLLINLSKSEEELLTGMHHKTRYNIKVAQKHGVEIKDEFDISIGHGIFFEEALKLIMTTSNRQKFGTFPESYYRKLADFFVLQNKNSGQPADLSAEASAKEEALAKVGVLQNKNDLKLHIYKAIFQNQLLATAVIIDFGSTRTFLFGGSSEFHKNVMAPYLLHWQAMQDAKTQGLSVYDFWGIETSSGATPGFVRFKLGFGGEEKEYAGAYDIVQNKLWYQIYNFMRQLNQLKRKFTL